MPVTTKDLFATPLPEGMLVPANPGAGEPHPADDLYAPPVSSVRLPSAGRTYPPESPLYLTEAVDIKAVTAKEEDILGSKVLIQKGIVMTALMRACITNRLIDPDKMLVGDRNAVLVSIRVSAYGSKYVCKVTCPECAETCEHAFDLGRLALKGLGAQPADGPGSNSFLFKLPVTGRSVKFRLMDADAVAKLDADTEAIRKKGSDRSVTLRLMSQVTWMEGVEAKDMAKALSNLPARDSRALRTYMDDIAPGVDMEQDFECQSCGKVSTVDIPIGLDFFWPSEV